MQPDEELARKLGKRYLWLTIISLFLMALLQGLHSFFFTLFFWPSIGFAVLAFYYRRMATQLEESSTAQWQGPGSPSGPNSKRITLIVIVSAVSLLLIISSIVSSRKNTSAASQETTQTVENTPENSEQKPGDYDKALQEFNNQNFRLSISIARQALISDPNNNDLMLVLGDDYGALKLNDSSFIWFDRAYQNGVRSAYLSHWLGYLNDDKGSYSKAIEFYKDALKRDSTRAQLYDRLAELEPEKAGWYKKRSTQWAEKK